MEPLQQDAKSGQSHASGFLKARASAGIRLALRRAGLAVSKSLLCSFGLVLTATMSATLGATVALVAPLSLPSVSGQSAVPGAADREYNLPYRLARPVNILVMGIDRVLTAREHSPEIFTGNSDTMLLLRLNPGENKVNMLSIPRDTRVKIPGVGTGKINSANVKGGPALAARTVSATLNGAPIDRYVRVSTGAFRELVDLLGGVEVFVPKPMYYVDETQKLHIDLAEGWQTLNGERAEQFARFRDKINGDIGRVQRQQALLKALRNRLTSPGVLPRLPQIIQVMQKYVDTNLSLEEMLAVVNFAMKIEQADVRMVLLPGRFSAPEEYPTSYWIMDEEKRNRLVRDYFQIASQPLPRQPLVERKTDRRLHSPLKIAIQNASSSPEIGDVITQYLEDRGFDNVYVVRDWPDTQLQTQIIVQKGDLQGASYLKTALGLGEIESDSTGDLDSDLTVRIGDDLVKSYLESPPASP
ncbi:LCP family protein [Kamptonema formosum]|uniref:LCP family protein n=1 Tax=Kamptonema formosum TaxID=331992 RepID=UPI001E48F44E|nr:LCP family protein [Oscillatoria sp. PCC 10802]